MPESGLTEIIPLMCTSALWGQYPLLSTLRTPLRVQRPRAVTGWLPPDHRYPGSQSLDQKDLLGSTVLEWGEDGKPACGFDKRLPNWIAFKLECQGLPWEVVIALPVEALGPGGHRG
ncbi:uncharacterized protein [Sagmatias obliquidens]|uniref:uncharacterized protein isoform X2 n=1 Tax=Sagmatias obliquidens TaxID=3371155 RepID=UPI000F43F2AB|nr:uncharacterized protein LOC113630354 isoform X2 [Lagenorhynchus obliquidens]